LEKALCDRAYLGDQRSGFTASFDGPAGEQAVFITAMLQFADKEKAPHEETLSRSRPAGAIAAGDEY
jgi:hypothetical protein